VPERNIVQVGVTDEMTLLTAALFRIRDQLRIAMNSAYFIAVACVDFVHPFCCLTDATSWLQL
jgi:hypothetical protein